MARTDRSAMALEIPDAQVVLLLPGDVVDPADADHGGRLGARLHGHDAPMGRRQGAAQLHQPRTRPGARLRESYGEEKFARLVALKDSYDPDNVFALNQNIPPSG